jgi:ribulose kinase
LTKIGLGELVDRGLGALGGVTGEKQKDGSEALVMTVNTFIKKDHNLGLTFFPDAQAGLPVGKGLSARAAKELGLAEGCAVGSGVIDACQSPCSRLLFSESRLKSSTSDAGWIGTVAALSTSEHDENPQETLKTLKHPALAESGHRLAAVAGTSTCHIVQSPEGVFVDGVWGPYKNAMSVVSAYLQDSEPTR